MMKLTWILLVTSCLIISWKEVDGFWVHHHHSVSNHNEYHINCRDCYVSLGGRKKKALDLSPCDTTYPQTFALYDLDDDKKIYLEEFAQVTQCTKEEMGSVFDKTDLNDDGHIDNVEFQFSQFYKGQKDHATVKGLDEVGEWVADSVDYVNKHGLKKVTLEITQVKKTHSKPMKPSKRQMQKLEELSKKFSRK